MCIDEINPNHPVTREVHDHWHKIVALLMVHFGLKEFHITEAKIKALPADMVVAFDTRGGGACVRLITMGEAENLARKEGGLPV